MRKWYVIDFSKLGLEMDMYNDRDVLSVEVKYTQSDSVTLHDRQESCNLEWIAFYIEFIQILFQSWGSSDSFDKNFSKLIVRDALFSAVLVNPWCKDWVGILVSADIQYRPIFTHIGKTDISVSVLTLVPIYQPIHSFYTFLQKWHHHTQTDGTETERRLRFYMLYYLDRWRGR